MAGTRLLIQIIAVLQILVLGLWSFHYGLCRNDDILCAKFWTLIYPPSPLPCVPTVTLPTAQVTKSLSTTASSRILTDSSNDQIQSACQNDKVPSSHEDYPQPLWLCHHDSPGPLRLVNRDSTLMVHYSSEKELEAVLFPRVLPPQTFRVQLLLEDTSDGANHDEWMSIVDNWMTHQAKFINQHGVANSNYWPCLEDVQVDVQFVSPSITSNWDKTTITTTLTKSSSHDEEPTTNSTAEASGEEEVEGDVQEEEEEEEEEYSSVQFLSKPSKDQVHSLFASTASEESSSSSSFGVAIYVPTVLPQETYSWKTSSAGWIVLPSSPDSLASDILPYIGRWLTSEIMGVPGTMDSDGTFPAWYSEHYRAFLINDHYRKQLKSSEGECSDNDNDDNKKDPLDLLRERIASQQQQKMEKDFPLEHYAAIFAPLLFPLAVPLLAGVIREWKRYKEKTAPNNRQQDGGDNENDTAQE